MMNSKQWGALAARAEAVMRSAYSRHALGASKRACALANIFHGRSEEEQAAEALASWRAKPSVCQAARERPVGGKFGSWRWYRQDDGTYAVASNRRLKGNPEAETLYQALRECRRATEAQYAEDLTEAADLVRGGAVLEWKDGQRGGFFRLPSGRTVSAPGLARRLGAPMPQGTGRLERAPGHSPEWNSWRDDQSPSRAFTAWVVGPEEIPEPTVWQDLRERARARALRNTSPAAPRPCSKGKPWTRETPLREALAFC